MIELMEKRQRTLDRIRSWDAISLDQIQGRIQTSERSRSTSMF